MITCICSQLIIRGMKQKPPGAALKPGTAATKNTQNKKYDGYESEKAYIFFGE